MAPLLYRTTTVPVVLVVHMWLSLWLRVGVGLPRGPGEPHSLKQLCSSLALQHPARRHGAVDSTPACTRACMRCRCCCAAHLRVAREACSWELL